MINRLILTIAAVTSMSSNMPAHAQEDEIYYGSRAGMSLTTTGKSGIGTADAVIEVEHLPRNAKAFCVEYAQDNSMACVRRTLAEVRIKDKVTANCPARTWDVFGQEFVFLGRAVAADDIMADYVIRRVETNEVLDGSSASGYWQALGAFQALCPGIAD